MIGDRASPDRTAAPPIGPVRPFDFPPFERLDLNDGLVLFAVRRGGTPLVFLELVTPAGASFDPEGRSGLAALTTAMIDEGTPGKTSREIAAAAERIGGYLSATTDWDSLSIDLEVVSPLAGTALELAGEILSEPTFPEDELVRLRDHSLAEIRRRSVIPSVLASRQFARALYGRTPFGQPLIGTAASVEAIERADIEGFYRDRVAAAKTVLIAAGDFDLDRLHSLARRVLAGFPRRASAPRPSLSAAPEPDSRLFLVDRPEAAQTELRIGHVGLPRSHPDFTAVSVMNSLLGGKFTSRLNINLRERRGFTYSVYSSFSRRRGAGPFVVSSAVATEHVGQAIAEIRRELEKLQDEPPSAAELDETKSYILGVFPYTLQSLEGLSDRLREIAVHDLPIDHWDRYPQDVRAVDGREILRVAREHLHPDRLTIVAVGPEAVLRPQLEPLGAPTVWRPAERPEPV